MRREMAHEQLSILYLCTRRDPALKLHSCIHYWHYATLIAGRNTLQALRFGYGVPLLAPPPPPREDEVFQVIQMFFEYVRLPFYYIFSSYAAYSRFIHTLGKSVNLISQRKYVIAILQEIF